VDLSDLGSESETCVGSRVCLVGVSISFEKNFYWIPFTPPPSLWFVASVLQPPPSFLDWSGDAITFSREDHPNRIPNPGLYPLVINPIIGNARFSKVLMDGGSSLNILYAHTLQLMGIRLDQLRPSTTLFHGVAPGKRVQPLGQIDLPVWFSMLANFRMETLTFEVVGFRGAYHAILG
jgi:hypothetical protein